MLTNEEKKKQALHYMQYLGIKQSVIKRYDEDGTIFEFDGYTLEYKPVSPSLLRKIKKYEKEHDDFVYLVTRSRTLRYSFVEYWTVSKYEDDQAHYEMRLMQKSVYAYCINVTVPAFSELGLIHVNVINGFPYRVG